MNVNKGAIKKGKKVNVPPQNREAFTSAIASSGNSKQEIQLLNREVVRMRGGGSRRLLEASGANSCTLFNDGSVLTTQTHKHLRLLQT